MGSDNVMMRTGVGTVGPSLPPPPPSLDDAAVQAAIKKEQKPQGQNANYLTRRGLGSLNTYQRTLLAT